MYRQNAGKRRSSRKSKKRISKRHKRVSKRSSRVNRRRASRRRSRCNRRTSKKSCKRKSRGKKRCSWVKSSKKRKGNKGYCRQMGGGDPSKHAVKIPENQRELYIKATKDIKNDELLNLIASNFSQFVKKGITRKFYIENPKHFNEALKILQVKIKDVDDKDFFVTCDSLRDYWKTNSGFHPSFKIYIPYMEKIIEILKEENNILGILIQGNKSFEDHKGLVKNPTILNIIDKMIANEKILSLELSGIKIGTESLLDLINDDILEEKNMEDKNYTNDEKYMKHKLKISNFIKLYRHTDAVIPQLWRLRSLLKIENGQNYTEKISQIITDQNYTKDKISQIITLGNSLMKKFNVLKNKDADEITNIETKTIKKISEIIRNLKTFLLKKDEELKKKEITPPEEQTIEKLTKQYEELKNKKQITKITPYEEETIEDIKKNMGKIEEFTADDV